MMHTQSVTLSDLPKGSLLLERVKSGDFLDCYSVPSGMPVRRAAEIITNFPDWARFLLQIRKLVTAPFGLLNDGPASGDKVGIFPVEVETERELVAGFNDRHLNFRVSVVSEEGRVFLATWVRPHNIGGQIYLKAIMPFHILISRDALARVHMQDAAAA